MASLVAGTRTPAGRLAVDLALGLLAGIAGYAINRMPLSLGAGVEFYIGSFLAFMLLPRSVPAATLGGMIAAGHLLLVWSNPYAWVLTALEIPAVAALGRWRGIDPVSADAIYWAVVGTPCGYVAYHLLSDFRTVPAALAILQQALGGFFSVSLACVAGLILQAGPRGATDGAPIPLRATVIAVVSVAAISTGILILAIDARLYWRTLVEDRAEEITRIRDLALAELTRLREEAGLLVVALAAAAPDAAPKAELAQEAGRLLAGIDARDAGGTLAWRWRPDDGPATIEPRATLAIPVERGGRSLTATAALRTGAIDERLQRLSAKGTSVVLRDADGQAYADPTGLARRLPQLDWHCLHLRPDGSPGPDTPDLRPMVAPILVWAAPLFCAEAAVPAFPGLRLMSAMAVADVTRRHHRALLDTMLLVAAICGLGVASAALLARAVARRIENIREALAAGPGFRFVPRPGGASAIAEIRLLEQDIGRLSEALDREAAEASLMRRRLETIAEHTPIIVYILDLADGGATPSFVTHSVERILGYPRVEALTWEWWARNLHPEDAPSIRAELRQVAETGGFSAEFRLRGKDGAYRWLYDEIRVIDDPDGR
ncbi:MAG: PAS domain-containing protein, partial [Alphaproteobacteria bacterium]|nr:PAS domain-containing protein [Alphaproteobacteria bacterium]